MLAIFSTIEIGVSQIQASEIRQGKLSDDPLIIAPFSMPRQLPVFKIRYRLFGFHPDKYRTLHKQLKRLYNIELFSRQESLSFSGLDALRMLCPKIARTQNDEKRKRKIKLTQFRGYKQHRSKGRRPPFLMMSLHE